MKRLKKKIGKLTRKEHRLIDKIYALEQKKIEIKGKRWLLYDELEKLEDVTRIKV